MKITIAERLHPFSHKIGTKFLLPMTSWTIKVFPTRLEFCDLECKQDPFFLSFDFLGPIQGFTAQLDLEKGCLHVFGTTQRGYMRYQLCVKEDGIWLMMEKIPEEKVFCRISSGNKEVLLTKSEPSIQCNFLKRPLTAACDERLSLGMHKAQDFDLVLRRLDCKEIFPHWLRLGNLSPSNAIYAKEDLGNYRLLNICREKIEHKEKEGVLKAFGNLFQAAFEGVFAPRLTDTDYQGILPESETLHRKISPMPLLIESSKLIRSLFFQEENGAISLLPCLPIPFHCGRMLGLKTLDKEVFDFEWSKKTLRTVLVHSALGGELRLKLPKGIRSFRLTCGKRVVKKIETDTQGRVVLQLDANRTSLLDRLEG